MQHRLIMSHLQSFAWDSIEELAKGTNRDRQASVVSSSPQGVFTALRLPVRHGATLRRLRS